MQLIRAVYTSFGIRALLERHGYDGIEIEKSSTDVEAIGQLWIAYLHQHIGARHRATRALVQLAPFACDLASVRGAVGRIEAVEQAAAGLHAVGLGRTKQLVGPAETGHRRMIGRRADEERRAGSTENAARANVRGTEDRVADALDQPDVGCRAALAGPYLRQDGAEVR